MTAYRAPLNRMRDAVVNGSTAVLALEESQF